MKSVYFVIPVVQKDPLEFGGQLPLISDWLDVQGAIPELYYGVHGVNSRGPVSAAAYQKAREANLHAYWVDVAFRTKAVVSEVADVADLFDSKAPMFIGKRITVACGKQLGEWWQAKVLEDARLKDQKNKIAKTDFDLITEYVPAFPSIALQMFADFPQLHMAVLPFKLGLTGNVQWIGVFPKAKADVYVAGASVRDHPDAKVVVQAFDAKGMGMSAGVFLKPI
jgi:hypothetical protein